MVRQEPLDHPQVIDPDHVPLAARVADHGGPQGGLEDRLWAMPDGLEVVRALVLHRSPYASPSLASVLERLSGQKVVEPANGHGPEDGGAWEYDLSARGPIPSSFIRDEQ